jgi:hypothetical protein
VRAPTCAPAPREALSRFIALTAAIATSGREEFGKWFDAPSWSTLSRVCAGLASTSPEPVKPRSRNKERRRPPDHAFARHQCQLTEYCWSISALISRRWRVLAS